MNMKKIECKCWKCGEIIWVDSFNDIPLVCLMPMYGRTGGVCGGSYIAEFTSFKNDEDTIDNA